MAVRRYEARREARDIAEPLQASASSADQSHYLKKQGHFVHQLIATGAVQDSAAQGFLTSLTACPPPIRWLGVKPYEALSLERTAGALMRTKPQGSHSPSCLSRLGKQVSQQVVGVLSSAGHVGNELSQGLFAVLSSYAVGIALISQIFESWAEHGKISSQYPATASINVTGNFTIQDPTAAIALHTFAGEVLDCDFFPQPECTAPFSYDSDSVEEPLEEYEIPNLSLVTDRMKELGLMVGLPGIVLAFWWSRQLGALGLKHAYEYFRPSTQAPISSPVTGASARPQ